jgi:glycosyltransferase AglI
MVRVSTVLPAYNEEKCIVQALGEIDKQSFRDRELIVVDDGSTDKTGAIASAWAGTRADIRVIRTEHRGPSHARNVGANAATGRILFFAESDCTYLEDYLEKAVRKLEDDKDFSAVCLTGAPLMVRSTLATECIDVENKVQHRLLNEGKIRPFYAWVFSREPFLKVGGFDEKLFQGEDKDLFRRFESEGYRVGWVPGIHWWHRRDQTTWSLARKWFQRGKSRVLYSMKHRLILDLARSIAPFWVLVIGLLLFLVNPLVGGVLVLMVVAAFLAQTIRIASISWRDVERRRVFLGYPIFIATRNFSTGIGYLAGLLSIAFGGHPGASLDALQPQD